MANLRYLTAGESHGKGLVAILEGLPVGVAIDTAFIDAELRRRQQGYGRGGRMKIERDSCEVLAGTRKGVSTGGPLALFIKNRDYRIENISRVGSPRPGHADLAGILKYGFTDIRDVLERASARGTAATVALGACAKLFLGSFRIRVSGRVVSIAGETSPAAMRAKIDEARERGDTVGGIFEVTAEGVPAGLGSYVQPDRRLDGRIAQSVMAIPGIKGVEIGLGFGYAATPGSASHDPIFYSPKKGFTRTSNNAGGIEGGISNGEPVVVRGCMKPIATLLSPLPSVDIATRRPAKASVERSDICAVEAAGVVAESCVSLVLADALIEKFGGDSLSDNKAALAGFKKSRRLK